MADPRLTLILQDLLPHESTGVARYCGNLLRELRKAGVPFRERRLASREFHVGPVRFGYYLRIAWHRATVRPSGVVHSFSSYVVPPGTDLVTVYDTFSYPDTAPSPLARWLFRHVRHDLVHRPRFYVSISEAVRMDLNRRFGIPMDRIRVAPPGVDLDLFRPEARESAVPWPRDGKTTVLHVGHGYKRKRIDVLVEALGQLGPERFRLVRVGPATDPAYVAAYQARARQLGLELLEVGYVPDADLPSYYANADLLAFPSQDEGAGLPPMEAMACGTNIVVADLPAHHEMCADAAFYAPPGADALARTIEAALSRPRPAEALRDQARKLSWARTADVYVRIYEELGIHPDPGRSG